MKRFYNAVIENVNQEFTICFPDFPGCVAAGDSVTSVLANGRDSLEFHIESMAEDQEDIPESSSPERLNEFLAEARDASARPAIVEVEVPDGERERINVSIPKYVLKKIDAFAAMKNRTRSALLTESALDYIRVKS